MRFFYVTEKNNSYEIIGSVHYIYTSVIEACKKEKHHRGVLGAVDTNHKLRATLVFNYYDKKFRTPLHAFIRKYAAIGALEQQVKKLREKHNG